MKGTSQGNWFQTGLQAPKHMSNDLEQIQVSFRDNQANIMRLQVFFFCLGIEFAPINALFYSFHQGYNSAIFKTRPGDGILVDILTRQLMVNSDLAFCFLAFLYFLQMH